MSDAPPAEAIAPPAADVPAFPADDSLCESCGYSLRGLTGSERCPECGTPLAESDPARRVGLPWQNRMSVGSWLKTTWMMVRFPAVAFRQLRLTKRDSLAVSRRRLYVVFFALLFGFVAGSVAAFLIFAWARWRFGGPAQWGEGVSGLGALWGFHAAMIWLVIYCMSWIESIGVAWVSRRRGWRVPMESARLVTAYATVGWLPAAVVVPVLHLMFREAIDLGWTPFRGNTFDIFIFIAIFAISILWFETLVWLGVRQVRYANFAYPAGSNLTR